MQQHNLKKLKKKTADKKEVKPSLDSKMIKRLTCFRHHDILTTTRSRMTTAIRFSRQNDTGSCAHITRLVIVLVLEPKAMLTLEPIFVPTLKVIRYSMNTYPICDFAPLKKLVSLSSNVFERYTSTGSGLFSFVDSVFAQIF